MTEIKVLKKVFLSTVVYGSSVSIYVQGMHEVQRLTLTSII